MRALRAAAHSDESRGGTAASWRPPEPGFDVVAFGASAGGIDALTTIASGLPGDFPVPVVVAQHLKRGGRSFLAEVLQRRSRLRVMWAQHGAPLRPRTIYLEPPNLVILWAKGLEPAQFRGR